MISAQPHVRQWKPPEKWSTSEGRPVTLWKSKLDRDSPKMWYSNCASHSCRLGGPLQWYDISVSFSKLNGNLTLDGEFPRSMRPDNMVSSSSSPKETICRDGNTYSLVFEEDWLLHGSPPFAFDCQNGVRPFWRLPVVVRLVRLDSPSRSTRETLVKLRRKRKVSAERLRSPDAQRRTTMAKWPQKAFWILLDE